MGLDTLGNISPEVRKLERKVKYPCHWILATINVIAAGSSLLVIVQKTFVCLFVFTLDPFFSLTFFPCDFIWISIYIYIYMYPSFCYSNPKLQLDPIDFRSTQLICHMIMRCLTSDDRFHRLRGMSHDLRLWFYSHLCCCCFSEEFVSWTYFLLFQLARWWDRENKNKHMGIRYNCENQSAENVKSSTEPKRSTIGQWWEWLPGPRGLLQAYFAPHPHPWYLNAHGLCSYLMKVTQRLKSWTFWDFVFVDKTSTYYCALASSVLRFLQFLVHIDSRCSKLFS